MRRLSLTIFLAVLASLLLFALAVVGIWTWSWGARAEQLERRIAAVVADPVLQDPASDRDSLQRALHRLQQPSRLDLTIVDDDNRLVAQAGRPIVPRHRRHAAGPPIVPDGDERDGEAPRWRRWVATFDLPGDRWLLVRPPRTRPPPPPVGLLSGTALLTLAVALVAWPVSRRITRRLERLQQGVEQLGAGVLEARVRVEGRDEVAALARSVNASASRIEALVSTQARLLDSQRRLLANASHELRSPLARIRLALEFLLPERNDEALRDEALRSVAELDRLIDEILTASRIDAAALGHGDALAREPVDLAGLAAEEAVRVDAEVEVRGGGAAEVPGDPRLLRRLLRNLLENARRYHRLPVDGAGEAVQLVIDAAADPLSLAVLDRGPGVPVAERDRIFEAFYRVEGHSEGAGGVGLGLALARQIARAHGGDVRCEPRDGGGSAFIVTLAR